MHRRRLRLASEAAKFLTVGGVATGVAFVLFNLLVHGFLGNPAGPMNDRPLTAYVIANTVGMVVSYRGSRWWAFRHREPVGPASGRLQFVVINVVTMAIPVVCLAFSRYVLQLDGGLADNISANVVGLSLGTVARFWAFRKFVFRRPRSASRAEAAAKP